MRRSSGPAGDSVSVPVHDLRNIAASIYGCARTLLDADLPDSRRRELLTVIVEQCHRVVEMTESP
jgi:nitrogen-specific signal transduction histidine kinase